MFFEVNTPKTQRGCLNWKRSLQERTTETKTNEKMPRELFDEKVVMGALLCADTKYQYKSALKRLDDAGCTHDYVGLKRRFLLKRKGSAYTTLCGYMDAVNWELRSAGRRELNDHQKKHLRDLARGRENLERQPRIRGAITYPLLKQLLEWMREEEAPEDDLWMMRVCWGLALRRSQVQGLMWENVHMMEDDTIEVDLEKIHDPRRLRGAGMRTERRRLHQKAARAVREQSERRGAARGRAKQRVFTTWNEGRMVRWIKDGARALKWNPRLHWSGIHCLRHGVAAEIFAQTNDLDCVRETTGHEGPVGAGRYARSNMQRMKRLVRNNEQRAAAARGGR